MSSDGPAVSRFRSRKDAERILSEILGDGGVANEYRIEQDQDGACVILVLDSETGEIAGVVGA